MWSASPLRFSALVSVALTIACGSSDVAPNQSGDAAVSAAGAAGAAGATASSGGLTGSNGGASSSSGGPGAGGRASGAGGRAGVSGGSSTGGQGGTSAGCSAVGSSCDPANITCCTGLVCVTSTSADYAGCREPCTVGGTDCATDCCIPFGNFPERGFCGDAALCACSGKDEPCGGTRRCCAGMTCTTFDETDTLGCEPSCTTNADCTTDCCVAIPGTNESACLAPVFCGR